MQAFFSPPMSPELRCCRPNYLTFLWRADEAPLSFTAMISLNKESSETRFLRIAIVLGLLSAIGPFAIDMYLPALPSIGKDLTADPATVQMTLLAFFVAMGLGQIVVGPISDMIGRKAPMYLGLGLFVLGSIGSALAPGIHWLIVFRLIQGFGACPGMVVPRAVVRDLHTGTEAARLMSLLMLVFSVSPILAPLTGSFVIQWFGWRAVFWVVTVAALLAAILLATSLKGHGRWKIVPARVDRLDVLVSLLFAGNGFLGLVIPATSVLAMEDYGEFAGTASALMGTLQFATGAICMIVAGIFFDGTPFPMIAGIALCAVITFILAQITPICGIPKSSSSSSSSFVVDR